MQIRIEIIKKILYSDHFERDDDKNQSFRYSGLLCKYFYFIILKLFDWNNDTKQYLLKLCMMHKCLQEIILEFLSEPTISVMTLKRLQNASKI